MNNRINIRIIWESSSDKIKTELYRPFIIPTEIKYTYFPNITTFYLKILSLNKIFF